MIEVSKLAGNVLVQTLKASGVGPEKGFRLAKKEDGFALEIDTPADDDRVIKHEGVIALIVDQGTEGEVSDVLIDVKEGVDGPKLMMVSSKPPQE